MGKFATQTTVSPAKTLAEIQDLVEKYGCEDFAFLRQPDRVIVMFEMEDRRVKFALPLPDPDQPEFSRTPTGKARTKDSARTAYDQAVRSRWRALLLTIKAKLESVESGIESFEQAFMAQIVLPNGQTMSEWASPQIEQAYQGGSMPPLLGSGG